MKKLGKIYMVLILLFLYVPIFVLIVFSFNETKSRSVFSGFTFDWYIKLFNNHYFITDKHHYNCCSCKYCLHHTWNTCCHRYQQYEKNTQSSRYECHQYPDYQS